MMSNSDRSEEDESSYPSNEDPFYQYKPRHPTDVNLLATSNVRFVDEQGVWLIRLFIKDERQIDRAIPSSKLVIIISIDI